MMAKSLNCHFISSSLTFEFANRQRFLFAGDYGFWHGFWILRRQYYPVSLVESLGDLLICRFTGGVWAVVDGPNM